jgi:hypothetical protein
MLVATLTLLGAIGCAGAVNGADSSPRPPCGGETIPPYPDLDASPVVKFWDRAALGSDWTPPACTGWTTSGFSTLVTTTARFRHASGAQGLLRRIGAISELAGVRYWSTTRKQWHTLIVEAHAVSGPTRDQRRNDFTPDELAREQVLYFLQQDNVSGKATYRMRIISASPDRIVFDMENVSAMKYAFLTLFSPGEMQSIYFLDRESDDIWRYYSIFRTGKKASSLTTGHEASSINRAVAYYRHLTGIPTDKEPPAAR